MFVTNKDEAKVALRAGKVVHGDRQIGKTEALIEVIHEDHKGNAIVVTPSHEIGAWFLSRYRQLYPDGPKPKIEHPRDAGRGTSTPLYVDCYGMLQGKDQDDIKMRMAAAIW